jgi:hypothetical protein
MFAKIKRTKSARKTLQYNEKKVQEQKAVCLLAENYVKRTEDLSIHDKLDRLEQLASLNETAEKKTIHVFLNFDRTDALSDDRAIHFARRYMEVAGFEDQPYLVYRHHDAWHPHLHVVSTNVLPNGKLIDPGIRELWKLIELTRELEHTFSLKSNHAVTWEEQQQLKVTHAQQIVYGDSSLKRAISDVLNTVIDRYKYTSLDELNAILKEYNVKADRGAENSKLYQKKGLVYCALDENGHRITRGLKASSFSLKPTLAYLEQKFALNESLRESSRRRLETAIEWTFFGKTPDWAGFLQALIREGINTVIREEKDERSGGIFFVDHREKSVFSGESLGEQYTLDALQKKCVQQQGEQQEEIQRHHLRLRL